MVFRRWAMLSAVTGTTKYSGTPLDSTRIIVPERYFRGITNMRTRATAMTAANVIHI